MKVRLSPRHLAVLLYLFSMLPFILPFPGVGSDLQPYATLVAVCILLFSIRKSIEVVNRNLLYGAVFLTALISFAVLCLGQISIGAIRGFFNHASIFLVPLAFFLVTHRFGYQEKVIKIFIWVTFAIAAVQFVADRSFLSFLVSNPRFSSAGGRGVIGLSSEPSFFGVSCFYFLFLAYKFEKRPVFYMIFISVMAVLFAQSSLGVIFVLGFWLFYIVDTIRTRKGVLVLLLVLGGFALALTLIEKYGAETRLYRIFQLFKDGGVEGVVDSDVSAGVRMNSIVNALKEFLANLFLPAGYQTRIGSGYGGLLCELGLFAFLEIFVISYGVSLTFKTKFAKLLCFVLFTFFMFQNVQIGNPQILMIVGINLAQKRAPQKEGTPVKREEVCLA